MRKVYRIQAIGGSYYIAIPKEWLKKLNLGKGSHVEISIEPDGSLRIKPLETVVPEKGAEEAIARADIEVIDKDTVYSLLIWLYLRGYDVIALHFRESSIGVAVRNAIAKAKNILLGFEIVEEDSASVVLQVFASSDTDTSSIIKNMHRIARSMYNDAFEALLGKDLEKAYEVEARDQDLNRLYFYITRIIRKRALTTIDQNEILNFVDLRLLAKSIEEIGDDAKNIAKTVQEIILNNVELDSTYVDALRSCVYDLDVLHRKIISRADGKPPLAELIDDMNKCEKIRQKLYDIRKELPSSNPRGALYINEISRGYGNIAVHLCDIISLTPSTI